MPSPIRKHAIPRLKYWIATELTITRNSKASVFSRLQSATVFMSSRRRINPPAMSKPVPKSNMLPGSGVIDTVSLPEIGPSVTRNCIGWRVEESIPVKTTLVSAMESEVTSEDMLNPVNVVETKSLLPIKTLGVKVTPVQVNVASAGGKRGARGIRKRNRDSRG